MSARMAAPDQGQRFDAAELRRRQRVKNWLVGGIVAGLCVLFYLLTIVRMGRL
jgi:hypothetical protein